MRQEYWYRVLYQAVKIKLLMPTSAAQNARAFEVVESGCTTTRIASVGSRTSLTTITLNGRSFTRVMKCHLGHLGPCMTCRNSIYLQETTVSCKPAYTCLSAPTAALPAAIQTGNRSCFMHIFFSTKKSMVRRVCCATLRVCSTALSMMSSALSFRRCASIREGPIAIEGAISSSVTVPMLL